MAGKKAKRFDDGGMVGNSNYPFGQGQAPAAPASVVTGLEGVTPVEQTVPFDAQANTSAASAKPFGMKKGGKVSTARRGDGIAQRGKTRGRMV